MKPRISALTIGVADLERSLEFYRDGLGLPTEGIIGREFEHGAVAFFTLSGGLKLAIWHQDDLAYDTGLPKTLISSTSFTIGHNVVRREDVDEMMDEASRAGAEIIKPAQDTSVAAMLDTSATRMGIFGRLSGTRPTSRIRALPEGRSRSSGDDQKVVYFWDRNLTLHNAAFSATAAVLTSLAVLVWIAV